MRLLFALTLIGSSGCFNPTLNEVACGQFRECPDGLVCGDDDLCRAPGPSAAPDAGAADAAAEPAVYDVDHLPPHSENPGDIDALVAADIEIDTTAMSAGIDGAPFEIVDQQGSGPELAVLRLRSLTIADAVTVRVTGIRPLVIVASGSVAINGLIDGGARLDQPGPGAVPAGSGGDGVAANGFFSAGGGGGYALAGGAGGATEGALGGELGGSFGDPRLSVLSGGSPGGAAATATICEVRGGAGGGAIQISTPASITIGAGGSIRAGGGGGLGGIPCGDLDNVGGPGGGGGSGGAIYLQAPRVVNSGDLFADGGGGGGGAGDDSNEEGDPGTDAITGPGTGGRAGNDGGDGGDGGGTNDAARAGRENRTDNGAGGGGGGAIGRIAVAGELAGNGVTSPSIVVIP